MNIEGKNPKKKGGIKTSLKRINIKRVGHAVDLIGCLFADWGVYKPTRPHSLPGKP